MSTPKLTDLWDQEALEPPEQPRDEYLQKLYLHAIKIGLSHAIANPHILKTDLYNEGIANSRNILPNISQSKVTGIDISHVITARAKANGQHNVTTGDIRQFPFQNQTFDVLLDLSTSDHLPQSNIPQVFAEYARLLTHDGILVLIFDWTGPVWSLYFWYLQHVRNRKPDIFAKANIQNRYFHPINFVKRQCRASGFEILHEYCIDWTGWTWNRFTAPLWKRVHPRIDKFLLGMEYSRYSKYNTLLAKQYVIVAKRL